MTKSTLLVSSLALIVAAVFAGLSILPASADPPATDHFQRTWERTDKPVAISAFPAPGCGDQRPSPGRSTRTTPSAPDSKRLVQYFDKSRMEDTSWRTTTASLGRHQRPARRRDDDRPDAGRRRHLPAASTGPGQCRRRRRRSDRAHLRHDGRRPQCTGAARWQGS